MRTPVPYRLTRLLVRVALGVYFRRLEVTGDKNVPPSGPVILAANHPQSVTDALVLGLGSRRAIHYLAHSGLFRNRLAAWFLRQHGVIPVFRPRETTDAAEKNIGMFSACHKVMREHGMIGIFPEGTSAEERRVQKLKTGTARIALQSEDLADWTLGVKIVPVGLNFESRQRFRSRVLLRFGTSIDVRNYQDEYKEDPAATVHHLTADLHQSLRRIVINIEHSEFEDLVHDLGEVYKGEFLAREGLDVPGDTRFKRDQWVSREIPRALDYFFERSPELIWRVRGMLREYRRRLERLRVKDELLRQERGTSIPGAAARFVIWGAFGLPLAAYGTLLNYGPYKLTGSLAQHLAPDTTKIHYYRLLFGTPIYLVYYWGLLYFAHRSLGGAGPMALFALTLPLTGLFARLYGRRMAHRRERIRLGLIELRHGFYVQTLRQQRRRLIQEIDTAAAEYIRAARFDLRQVDPSHDAGKHA